MKKNHKDTTCCAQHFMEIPNEALKLCYVAISFAPHIWNTGHSKTERKKTAALLDRVVGVLLQPKYSSSLARATTFLAVWKGGEGGMATKSQHPQHLNWGPSHLTWHTAK